MAERTRGMGRGLAAILSPDARRTAPSASASCAQLPVELIAPEPAPAAARASTRRRCVALADSLRERGVLQPVLVRPLPGRHLRADRRRAPLARRPARRPRDRSRRSCAPHDDAESLELALIENMAREDLNPVEEARACALLVEELGLTREDVGRRVGRSRVAVSNLLRLLDLPDEVLDLLAAGDLTEGHGRALLMAPDHADRRRLARAAAARGLDASARPRRAPAAPAAPRRAPRPRAAPRRRTPTRSRPPSGSATRSAARSAPTSASPRAATGYRVALAFDVARRGARGGRAPRRARAPPDGRRTRRYHRAAARAISSVG